jgi:hypothetical protein
VKELLAPGTDKGQKIKYIVTDKTTQNHVVVF